MKHGVTRPKSFLKKSRTVRSALHSPLSADMGSSPIPHSRPHSISEMGRRLLASPSEVSWPTELHYTGCTGKRLLPVIGAGGHRVTVCKPVSASRSSRSAQMHRNFSTTSESTLRNLSRLMVCAISAEHLEDRATTHKLVSAISAPPGPRPFIIRQYSCRRALPWHSGSLREVIGLREPHPLP